MSFIIQAPYPAIALTTYLPNPRLGDSVAPTGSLDFKRAKDGTKYVYVTSRDSRRKWIWDFFLSQDKAYELQTLFDTFNSDQIKITDHQGKEYVGNFITNPFEFEATRRAVASPANFSIHQIQIEFEGFEQST